VFYPPTTPLLPLHDPPAHDIREATASSPRRSRLRTLATRMTRAQPADSDRLGPELDDELALTATPGHVQ
jgi:hypothetical protein